MRKSALPITLSLAALLPFAAEAQVGAAARATAQIQIDLPVVLPPTVVISPGIYVVPEVAHEVFFVDGVYWTRHPNGWYRSKSHRGGWVLVPARRVPPGLVKLPPGKYKHWKAARADDRGRGRGDHRHGGYDDHGRGKHAKHGKHGKH
jgi:hypothetical protein